MSTLIEMMSGVLRFFPNSMIVTLFVLGITTGRLAWILVSLGAITLTIITLVIQYVFEKAFQVGQFPGASVVEACSILPVAVGGVHSNVPSLWIAVSSFFVTYIFVNATNIYTQSPARISKEKLPVQQRKGMGLISMMAVLILFAFILVPRWWTTCETTMGLILGLFLGVGGGWLWWIILNACGSDFFPDIHGVMIGLKPGTLHTSPMACAPRLKG